MVIELGVISEPTKVKTTPRGISYSFPVMKLLHIHEISSCGASMINSAIGEVFQDSLHEVL